MATKQAVLDKLEKWFRVNGKMDYQINPQSKTQGKYITYKCKDIDDIFKTLKASNDESKLLLSGSGSLSFKEQMEQSIIPRVWQMVEKEKEHLNWLKDNNAPKEFIETSEKHLIHFQQRCKVYIEYVEGLS